MQIQKQTVAALFAVLVLGGGVILHSTVQAATGTHLSSGTLLARGDDNENDGEGRGQRSNNQIKNRGEDNGEDGGENEVENDESGLNEHVTNWVATDLTPSTTAIAPQSVQTYSDVLTVLKADQQAVTSLMAAADATTTLGANLSAGEASLLSALIAKYKSTFSTIKVRGTEINLQIAAVMAVVEPLGSGTIAPALNKLVLSVLNDFATEIKSLGELARQSAGVITAETASATTPVSTPATTPTPVSSGTTTYTMAQVNAANSAQKCWTVVSGSVYNLTTWIAQHPGGSQAILGICGKDGTTAYLGQHGGQSNPTRILAGYKIGLLQ